DNLKLAASQRRFLIRELQRLSPARVEFPMLAAEQVAAEIGESHSNPGSDSALQRSLLPGLWEFTTPNHRILALIRLDKLLAGAKTAVVSDTSLGGMKVTLVPTDVDAARALVTVPAGAHMPGWRLALSLHDGQFF